MKKAIIFLVLAPLIAIIAAAIYVINVPYDGPETFIKVSQGDGMYKIGRKLYEEKIIKYPRIFYKYSDLYGYTNKLRIGTYKIPSNSTMPEVLKILAFGAPEMVSVTIPEGKNIYEIATIMSNAQICSYGAFVNLAKDKFFVNSLGIDAETIEGYLYPDTYKFVENTDPEKVIKTMYELFKKKTSNLNFSDSYLKKTDIITLASIVEKETGAKFERATIAGVFYNRLRKKMRLQSDPTAIYYDFENYDGNITKLTLQKLNPYNTYRINGLPKGPICNPGIDAIKAAINPENHDYLYFVSRNDGTHKFSKSLKEHNEGVNFHQKTRANREGRSWRDLKQ